MNKPGFDFVELGKTILTDEAAAIEAMVNGLDDRFNQACLMITQCEGRVIFAGVGQSYHAACKSAVSMASLGQPSFYIHATEAVHGDMGMITPQDIVVFVSHSGETKETLAMLSVVKNLGPKTIAIVGKPESTLAKNCDISLSTGVKQEAGPIQFAPTSSTLAAVAMMDALLSAVAVSKGFSERDYARYHPAGSLGKMILGDNSL